MLTRTLSVSCAAILSMLIGSVAYCADPVPPAAPEVKQAQPAINTEASAATEPVGRVVWVKGKFKAVSPSNKERLLDKAAIIYLHDTLITDAASQAQIVFTDNSLMTFKPSTQFVIEQYAFDPKKKKGSAGKYIMNLIEGGFRTITGLIAKSDPQSYQVNTPVATIGVRGTDYAVYVSGGELYIGYYKGTPCVSGKEQQVCLSKEKPYAEVPKGSDEPRPVTKQPAVLKEKLAVVPASIAPSSDNSLGGLVTGSGSGTGTGTGGSPSSSSGSVSGTTTSSSSDVVIGGSGTGTSSTDMNITGSEVQVTAPKSPTGTVSSFCIVQ